MDSFNKKLESLGISYDEWDKANAFGQLVRLAQENAQDVTYPSPVDSLRKCVPDGYFDNSNCSKIKKGAEFLKTESLEEFRIYDFPSEQSKHPVKLAVQRNQYNPELFDVGFVGESTGIRSYALKERNEVELEYGIWLPRVEASDDALLEGIKFEDVVDIIKVIDYTNFQSEKNIVYNCYGIGLMPDSLTPNPDYKKPGSSL